MTRAAILSYLTLLLPAAAFGQTHALTPPAFILVGIIWRDIQFAVAWLLAAGFAHKTAP